MSKDVEARGLIRASGPVRSTRHHDVDGRSLKLKAIALILFPFSSTKEEGRFGMDLQKC